MRGLEDGGRYIPRESLVQFILKLLDSIELEDGLPSRDILEVIEERILLVLVGDDEEIEGEAGEDGERHREVEGGGGEQHRRCAGHGGHTPHIPRPDVEEVASNAREDEPNPVPYRPHLRVQR